MYNWFKDNSLLKIILLAIFCDPKVIKGVFGNQLPQCLSQKSDVP